LQFTERKNLNTQIYLCSGIIIGVDLISKS
jgi:hypothetical protein